MPGSLSALLDKAARRIENADAVLVALDFDGTLAPIAPRPEEAAVLPEAAPLLRDLAASDVTVAVLSGRAIPDLKRKLSLDLIYAGNHGLEIEGPGISFAHGRAARLRHVVDAAAWDVEAAVESVPGVFVERKGLTATAHYRQSPEPLHPWIEATIRHAVSPYAASIALKPARKAWEIWPRVKWNKGSALKLLADRFAPSRPLVICAGDDSTDEDMFRAIPDALSIRVGEKPLRARYTVSSPAELLEALRDLCSAISSGAPARLAR